MEATTSYQQCVRIDTNPATVSPTGIIWAQGGNDYAGCSGSGITFRDNTTPGTGQFDRQTYSLLPAQLQATVLSGIVVSERKLTQLPITESLISNDGWIWGGPATTMSCRNAPKTNLSFDEADSSHDQIVQVCLADGSVKIISVNIDLTTWKNLGNMAQGAPITINLSN
jgi:hypothetical protein